MLKWRGGVFVFSNSSDPTLAKIALEYFLLSDILLSRHSEFSNVRTGFNLDINICRIWKKSAYFFLISVATFRFSNVTMVQNYSSLEI